MERLETKVPKLLGKAVFVTPVYNGIWEFYYSSNDDKNWDENLATKDDRDKSNDLVKWLEENSIDQEGNFVFQGTNGVRCSIGWPEIEGLTRERDSPPGKGLDGYQLPYKTKCTYRSRVEVKWQPEKLGIPQEIREALQVMGYAQQQPSS